MARVFIAPTFDGEPKDIKGKGPGGLNPDWVLWYRTVHKVSTNIAVQIGKRKIRESLEPKVEQVPKTPKSSANPYGKRGVFFSSRG
jgi:hypothetical protein